jgi:hypothetical protein
MKKLNKGLVLMGAATLAIGINSLCGTVQPMNYKIDKQDLKAYNSSASNIMDNVFTEDGMKILPIIYENADQTISKEYITEQLKLAGLNVTSISTEAIGTGTEIKTDDGTTYTVLIYGDVDGDGYVDTFDAGAIIRHYVLGGEYTLTGINKMATMLDEDEELDTFDAGKIIQFFMGNDIDLVTNKPVSDKEKDAEEVVDYAKEITIKEPNKTVYIQGDSIDLTGGTVTATMASGKIENATITLDMISGFRPNVIGTQTITVTYKEATATFEVYVIEKETTNNNNTYVPPVVTKKDTKAPEITLEGESIVNLKVGDTYTDAGATAKDDTDGVIAKEKITATITKGGQVVKSIDTSEEGTYIITYTATDKAGNEGTATRTVNVTKPLATLTTINVEKVGNENDNKYIYSKIEVAKLKSGTGEEAIIKDNLVFAVGKLGSDSKFTAVNDEVAKVETKTNDDGSVSVIFYATKAGTYKITPTYTNITIDPIEVTVNEDTTVDDIVLGTIADYQTGTSTQTYITFIHIYKDDQNKEIAREVNVAYKDITEISSKDEINWTLYKVGENGDAIAFDTKGDTSYVKKISITPTTFTATDTTTETQTITFTIGNGKPINVNIQVEDVKQTIKINGKDFLLNGSTSDKNISVKFVSSSDKDENDKRIQISWNKNNSLTYSNIYNLICDSNSDNLSSGEYLRFVAEYTAKLKQEVKDLDGVSEIEIKAYNEKGENVTNINTSDEISSISIILLDDYEELDTNYVEYINVYYNDTLIAILTSVTTPTEQEQQ